MRIGTLAALLGLAVAGCTTSSDGVSEPNVVAVTATPLYLALKGPFCIGTIGLGSAAAAISELARPWPPVPAFYEGGDAAQTTRSEVNDDIVANCGPPYYVSP
jgi:hypothetical protein